MRDTNRTGPLADTTLDDAKAEMATSFGRLRKMAMTNRGDNERRCTDPSQLEPLLFRCWSSGSSRS